GYRPEHSGSRGLPSGSLLGSRSRQTVQPCNSLLPSRLSPRPLLISRRGRTCRPPPLQTLEEGARAEGPGLSLLAANDPVDQTPQSRSSDGDDVAPLMGEALSRLLAILHRGKHGAQIEHQPVRTVLMGSNSLAQELPRIARDLAHVALSLQVEAVLPLDGEGNPGPAQAIEIEMLVEEAYEGTKSGAGIVVLGLAQQQGRAPLHIAQIDIIPKRRTNGPSVRRHHQHHLRLGVIPLGGSENPDLGQVAHRRERLRLGKDLRVRPDANLQILRPATPADQQVLERSGLLRSGLERPQVLADQGLNLSPCLLGARRIAPCLLLDHPLQQADDEGDARSLDRLEIDRAEQPRPHRIAGRRGRIGQDVIKLAQPFTLRFPSRSRWIALGTEVTDGGKVGGDVDELSLTQDDDRRPVKSRSPDSADQRCSRAIFWQAPSRITSHPHRIRPRSCASFPAR